METPNISKLQGVRFYRHQDDFITQPLNYKYIFKIKSHTALQSGWYVFPVLPPKVFKYLYVDPVPISINNLMEHM